MLACRRQGLNPDTKWSGSTASSMAKSNPQHPRTGTHLGDKLKKCNEVVTTEITIVVTSAGLVSKVVNKNKVNTGDPRELAGSERVSS